MSECPVMTPAWASFLSWAVDKPEFRDAFAEETGTRFPAPPKNGLDAAIDRATGHPSSVIEQWSFWATANHWGDPAGVPDGFIEKMQAAGYDFPTPGDAA